MSNHVHQDEHITLGQAASRIPGRPSSNCVWRWCRRGVLGRNGERIRLEHVRLGGRVLTSERWLNEFGAKLAAADMAHFDRNNGHSATPTNQSQPKGGQARQVHLEQVNAALEITVL